MTYTTHFYDTIAHGCRTSSAVVVPLVLAAHRATSVVDVGCGQGWWGAEFAKYGCDVTGVDGGYVPDRALGRFVELDLMQPFPDLGHFDLAVCLEVAEHLPEARAAGFVADLCALADVVLFSAAIPHQTGAGHINLQWPSYWAAHFAAQGYGFDGSIRELIWTDPLVEPWYRQNLHLAVKGSPVVTLDLVHPVIHEWGRG